MKIFYVRKEGFEMTWNEILCLTSGRKRYESWSKAALHFDVPTMRAA
jgi:hypothetical protein